MNSLFFINNIPHPEVCGYVVKFLHFPYIYILLFKERGVSEHSFAI